MEPEAWIGIRDEAMLVLLEPNHLDADFSDEDIVHIGLEPAAGKISDQQLLHLIIKHLKLHVDMANDDSESEPSFFDFRYMRILSVLHFINCKTAIPYTAEKKALPSCQKFPPGNSADNIAEGSSETTSQPSFRFMISLQVYESRFPKWANSGQMGVLGKPKRP